MTRTIIAAMTEDRIIGRDGIIPWHYRGDLRRFRRLTMGDTVIMGRLTFESLNHNPLPGRRNIIVSTKLQVAPRAPVEVYKTFEKALEVSEGNVWFIGGAQIYEAALSVADCLDLTFVPDEINGVGVVRFPQIDLADWRLVLSGKHEDEPRLARAEYIRIGRGGTVSTQRKVVGPKSSPKEPSPLSEAKKLAEMGWMGEHVVEKAELIVSLHEHLGSKSDLPSEAVEGLLSVKSAGQNLAREFKRLREQLGLPVDAPAEKS